MGVCYMATTAKVYIVNEPVRFDHDTKRIARQFDLNPAMAYGDLVNVLPAGQLHTDMDFVAQQINDGLKDITKEDYLLLIGDPAAIAIAGAVAARNTGGCLQMLRWHPRYKRYDRITVNP